MAEQEHQIIDHLDQAALSLLRAARHAADQETTDRALALHQEAVKQDERLTLLGQVGLEAAGLYSDFENREQYFMRRVKGMIGGRMYNYGLRVYAGHLAEHRDPRVTNGGMRVALKTASSEVLRRGQEESTNRLHERMAQATGRKIGKARISTSHKYVSPSFLQTEPEFLDVDAYVHEEWYAISNIPFTDGHTVELVSVLRESQQDLSENTTQFAIKFGDRKSPGVVCLDRKGQEVIESDLYFPLGLLVAARSAVRASVPKRVSKRWR